MVLQHFFLRICEDLILYATLIVRTREAHRISCFVANAHIATGVICCLQTVPEEKPLEPEPIDGLFGVLELLNHRFEGQLLVVQANFTPGQFGLREENDRVQNHTATQNDSSAYRPIGTHA